MKLNRILRIPILIAAVAALTLARPADVTHPTQAATGLAGPQPFLVILCRFADAAHEPEPPAFFERLLFGPAPSLDDYWAAVSGGRISLAGSRVVGWVTLPRPEAGYHAGDADLERAALAADCIDAAGLMRAARDYAAVAIVFNRNADSRPRAGELLVTVDGARERRRVIWMPPAWMRSVSAWAHEMGHVFGLDHSSDNSNAAYADPWDAMSGMGGCACGVDHTAVAQFPIADDLLRLGWLDPARVVTVGRARAVTLDLAPLAAAVEAGALLVRIPVDGEGRYYTVEARARTGYDAHLPADAVVIHRVDPACADHPAHLVTHPGEPLTAAAGIWRPGETFTDAAAGVAISVTGRRGAGFRVTVRTGNRAVARPPTAEPEETAATVSAWPGGKLLDPAAAAGGDAVYLVAARETTLGISPAIEVVAWRAGAWSAVEQLPSGWSSLPGDAPAVVVGRDGTVFVAWAGAAKLFPTMGAGGFDADIRLARRAGREWAEPVRVNDDAGRAWQLSPALALGPDGALFLAWQDQREGRRDIYFAEVTPDGRVTANRRLNDDAGDASQGSPALAADEQGNVTVLWADERGGASEIYAARRDAAGNWAAIERLSVGGPDEALAPTVAADARGNVYAAWVGVPACGRAKGETGAIMAAFRPAGAGWLPAEAVAEAVHGGSASRPVLAAAPDGRVYLAWEERRGGGVVVYLAQRDAGGDWLALREFLADASAPAKPALAVDRAGTVYLAWIGADGGVAWVTVTMPRSVSGRHRRAAWRG